MTEHVAAVGSRVLLENDAIRVWSVDVAEGDELALHLHSFTNVGVDRYKNILVEVLGVSGRSAPEEGDRS